jgi:mRNA-degrading endonuclease RelE of RelBE toxin-antitoxin system
MSSGERLRLSVEDRFHSELLSLPRDAQKKVLRALDELRTDPSRESKPLTGYEGIWRRRVHPYRILFTRAGAWLHVYSVQHRSSVYRKVAIPQASPGAVDLPRVPAAPEDVARPGEEVASDAWDSVTRLVISQNAEDLYDLIDFGMPSPLFDELYRYLSARKDSTQDGNIRLIRRNVIDSFFGRLLLQTEVPRPLELIIVSPWITPWTGERSSFDALVRYLDRYKPRTTVLTRTPVLDGHKVAVSTLERCASVELTFLDDLHAKFFVCEIAPVPYALVASANSTERSFTNFEVGISVKGTGEAEGLVRDLQGLAVELRSTGRRIKRRFGV